MDSIQGDVDNLLRTRPAGDDDVLEAMVVGYRAPVYRLALSILNDVFAGQVDKRSGAISARVQG